MAERLRPEGNTGMIDWTFIASQAYKAYGEYRHYRTFDGKPMPLWDDLPDFIQKAWEVACHVTAEALFTQITGQQ